MDGVIRIDSLGNISGLTGKIFTFPVEPVFNDDDGAKLLRNCLKYLGKHGCNNVTNPAISDDSTYEIIFDGIDEVRALSDYRMAYIVLDINRCGEDYYTKSNELDLSGTSLRNLFNKNNSECVLITASTLGEGIDKRIDLYKNTNVAQMVLLNACSSAYVEYMVDKTEKMIFKECNLIEPSFRFAPGYGDVPISRQRQIFSLFEKHSDKLRITLNENCFMYPVKSMTGITGCKRGI